MEIIELPLDYQPLPRRKLHEAIFGIALLLARFPVVVVENTVTPTDSVAEQMLKRGDLGCHEYRPTYKKLHSGIAILNAPATKLRTVLKYGISTNFSMMDSSSYGAKTMHVVTRDHRLPEQRKRCGLALWSSMAELPLLSYYGASHA